MDPRTTNFEKFKTGNPLVRHLITRFFTRIRSAIEAQPVLSILDAGCGEGMTLLQVRDLLPARVAGFDINPDSIAYAHLQFPQAEITVQDIYDLPYPDKAFDLVLCLEVLEHLTEPRRALQSLKRVSRRTLLLSVPHEPWFRLGSLARGKYLQSWGNHPEHLNHWNPSSFAQFLRADFAVVQIGTSFPWIVAQAQVD